MMSVDCLQSHALFGGLTDDEMKVILPLLKEEHFSKGDEIVHEGDSGDRLFFICSGTVSVLKSVKSAKKNASDVVAVLKQGDTFGEMALIDIQSRSATIKALENVTVYTLLNQDMHTIYKTNTKIYTMIIMNIARELSRRLRKMDDLVSSLLYKNQ